MSKNKDRIKADPELFRDLINRSNDAFYVVDPPTGRFIFVNEKACESLGYDRRELLGMGVMDIEAEIPDHFSWQKHVDELRQKGSLIFEGLHKRKNGSTFPVEANISHVVLNTAEYLVTVVRDLTERRQIESAMRLQSEITGNICEGIYLVSSDDLRIVYANPKMEEMFGYDRGEMNGKHVSVVNAPAAGDPAETANEIEKALKRTGTWRGEVQNIRKDGTTFWGNATVSMLHHPEYGEVYLSLQTDITERKKIENALQASEERYRHLFEDSPVCLWEEDITELLAYIKALRSAGITDFGAYFTDHPSEVHKCVGLVRVISVNKTTLELYEASDQNSLLNGLSQIFTVRSLDAFRGILIALVAGTEMYECETVNQTLTGKSIDILLRWSLISRDRADRSRALISIVDITKRKRAEEALQLTRFTVDNAADAVYWMDAAARIVDVNETACSMLGYSREEMLNLAVFDIDPDFTPDKWTGAWEALKLQEKRTTETRHQTKDGRVIPVEVTANYLSFGGKELDCAFVRDISERKKAEENLLKTQKLESLGVLAGGIAHDFNNILTAILGNISLARISMKPDDPQFKRLEEAERASFHARELTQQLLTFAKGGTPVKSTMSLEQLLRNSVGFAMRGSNVRCDFSFGKGLAPVDVDKGQMGQVFNNLLINACQAMPEGGIIRIDGRNVDIGPTNGMSLPGGKYLKINIEDQGTGISEAHLQKIFDPYFTTKQKGSGLGLSIVHSVVRNHGGNVTVKSRLGVGTTFIIYLPASTNEIAERQLRGEDHFTGEGRILLMDDEEIVRNVSGEILKRMGYEVEFASDGAEAIRLYKAAMASSRPFDAVIMDLTVPGGMGGREAIQKLRETDPAVKAVVSSGYSQDPIMANYREYGFCEVIAKPFNSMELARIMRAVIAGQ